MRRLLLIALASVVGATSLFALYVAIDLDPENLMRTVQAPSYDALFEASVRQRTGRTYQQLDEARRLKVLGDIIASRESDPVREVALFRTRALTNRRGAYGILRRHLLSLKAPHFEVAVGSLAALGLPEATRLLDSLHRVYERSPAAHTPLGGYRTGALVATTPEDGLMVRFVEQARGAADYSRTETSEMALFFPSDVELFVAMPNADDVLERFGDSRFMAALDGTPVPEDAWALPGLRTLRGLRSRLSESLGFLGRFFAPEELLQDHLLVGRYNGDYLLATYKDKNVSIAEALIRVFEALGRDFGIRRWSVGGTSASAIVNKRTGSTMSFATVGDYLVVATDTALMTRALRTRHVDQARSLAIDPVFSAQLASIDQTGQRDVLFSWVNPGTELGVTGTERGDALRLTVLSAALSRPITPADPAAALAARLSSAPAVFGSTVVTGDSATQLWQYVVDVRSLGRSAVDSLARVAGVDIARTIAPVLGRTWAIGYGGVEFLSRPYGYSHTGFSLAAAVPLVRAPRGFDSTLRRFIAGISFLAYDRDSTSFAGTTLWIARDTTSNDSTLLARRLQPSFAVLDDAALVVGTTPAMLRALVGHFRSAAAVPVTGTWSGSVRIDSLATNAARYLRALLLRGDRYSPEEIQERIDPVRRAVSIYQQAQWELSESNGVRTAWLRIH